MLQALIYSDGEAYLDDCDFSGSSAPVLVYSHNESAIVIRNAVLGDNNCESHRMRDWSCHEYGACRQHT